MGDSVLRATNLATVEIVDDGFSTQAAHSKTFLIARFV
jgi:hypothetical protein